MVESDVTKYEVSRQFVDGHSCRGLRQQNFATVRDCSNSRGPINGGTAVIGVCLSDVDGDADFEVDSFRPVLRCNGFLNVSGGCNGVGDSAEEREDAIAFTALLQNTPSVT